MMRSEKVGNRIGGVAEEGFPPQLLQRARQALEVTATGWGEASTRAELSEVVSKNVIRAVEKETGIEWSDQKSLMLQKYIDDNIDLLKETHVTLFKNNKVVYSVSFLVWLLCTITTIATGVVVARISKGNTIAVSSIVAASSCLAFATFWRVSSTWMRFGVNMLIRYVCIIGGGLGLWLGFSGIDQFEFVFMVLFASCALAGLFVLAA
jgi:hypothetical protein